MIYDTAIPKAQLKASEKNVEKWSKDSDEMFCFPVYLGKVAYIILDLKSCIIINNKIP